MIEIEIPFDPLHRARQIEGQVMSGNRRKYYRFRVAGFYGGIVTADAVGCSFLCAYCWNYQRNLNPEKEGQFFSPEEVVDKLLFLARQKRLRQMRISGAEPVLGDSSFDHLLEILKIVAQKAPDFRFILETNGLILGQSRKYARSLSEFDNLLVRVCLKATDREKFQLITGASRDYFFLPVQALLYLKEYGVKAWPALMADLFGEQEIARFRAFLQASSIRSELELEELIVYPFVEENLKRRKINIASRK